MTKRQAEENLDISTAGVLPVSKRPRIESDPSRDRLAVLERRSRDGQGSDEQGSEDEEEQPETTEAGDEGHENGNGTLDHSNALDEQSALTSHKRQEAPTEGYTDLYLDTINRSLLDFDFEKLCSVSLSNINVYACLVCGKYYQGRGPQSHAYFHGLEVGHHVFVNMGTKKVYVLPEGYEVQSKSLEDIKFVVDPRYTKEEVMKLDAEPRSSWDLAGKRYTPGFVGLNNIKANDYLNVIVHALAHVPPLRNFFMLEELSSTPQLAQRFSILVRKIWNPRAFKSHVSPHELLQEVSLRSNKRFTLIEQSDPVDFLSWFLNHLHLALGGSKTKAGTSIIQKVFQGRLKMESQQITAKADAGDRLRFEEAAEVKVDINRFLILTLDLPAAPLFQDELDKNIIPQVPLVSILSKYDGVRSQEHLAHRRRYRLLHPLPPYLIFHIKRFSRNKFVDERNPTIVTFPVRSLDMSPYIEPGPASPNIHDPDAPSPAEPIWYDLVANITHEAIRSRDDSVEGETPRKVWRVQLRDRARDDWIQVQDLFVEDVRKEILFLGESYLQVWEKRRNHAKRTT